MGDPDSKKKNLQLAEINIKRLLEGDSPRLIDEWQEFPRFWDSVRFQVFKMVLTAVGEVVYRRKDDGVIVCPISALKP